MNDTNATFPLNDLTQQIIGAAIEVHKHLGPGLLESAYERCLVYELGLLGFKVEEQKPLPIIYKEVTIDQGYRIDLLVEDQVVVELKTVEQLSDLHEAQVLTYLRLSGLKIGLLINFNVKVLRYGIRRFIL